MLVLLSACGGEQKGQPAASPGLQATDATLINPVLPGDHPDPTVVQIGDTYWASATSNEWSPLFPIYKSTDLQHWELVTYVFPEGAPDWALNNFWAPELSYDSAQQKVYVYYTARDKQSKRLSVAVASADSPEGPYQDHGPLVAQEYGSIDAYEVRDKDGKLYVLWKEDGNSKGQPTPIWAQEVNAERTKLVGEKHELFRNDAEWEGQLVEGVSVFPQGDYWYATYSAGACCETTCNYKTGVARANNLLGPWEKYDKNPVLQDNEDWTCAGHGTVIRKDGDWHLLYHAYNTEGSVYVGREGILEKMQWTEDGWPVFENTVTYNRPIASVNFEDNFEGYLHPIWQWRVTQDIDYQMSDQGLLLGASSENNELGTLLVQKAVSPNYNMTATVEPTITEGGIALVGAANNGFGAPVAAMGISAGGNALKVWQTKDGKTDILAEAPLSGKVADLRMAVTEGHRISFAYKKGEQWETLLENQEASHLVPWGMGFRLGLVAKGQPDTYANFKQVRIQHQ